MLRLYTANENGSLEIMLIERVAVQEWEALRRNAVRLMRARLCYEGSITHLKETPYELWKATNGFGDNFEILYYRADIERYTEVERENNNETFFQHYAYPDIASALENLGRHIRFIAIELDVSGNVRSVPTPGKLEITSAVVDAALTDAETLIRSSGPPNALDRVHTALQGYLETICEKEGITVAQNASITTLFSRIREEHAALKITDPQAQRMTVQILRGMAQIIDALNPIRNDKTLAHPNPLLDEAEAMLAIHAIRTLLHYLVKLLFSFRGDGDEFSVRCPEQHGFSKALLTYHSTDTS
jgi:Abortive infection C-terminus